MKQAIAMTFAFLMFACGVPASGADYPEHNVRVLIPFSAGGATDVIARVIATALSSMWGQPVVPDNVPGATGTIAATQVARAEPDGYTLLVGTASVNSVLPSVRKGLNYDTLKDYAPIAMLSAFPNVLVVRSDFPAHSVAELIDLLKAKPGKLNFGSSGYGGSIHLAGELFKLYSKTEMTHVAYAGSAPALTDLIGGRVEMMFDNLADVAPHIKAGTLRALGVASAERSIFLPGVPTIAETLPGFEATSWVGVLAPAKTPEVIRRKLAGDITKVLSIPQVSDALKNIGAEPGQLKLDEFGRFLADDVHKWQRVVDEAKLHVE